MRQLTALAATIAIASSTGCSIIKQPLERFADLVHDYCRESVTDRTALRAVVNERTKPNAVQIHCAGDPETSRPF